MLRKTKKGGDSFYMKYQYNLGRIELGRKFKVRELILALVIFVGLMIPIIRNAIKANSLSDTTPP